MYDIQVRAAMARDLASYLGMQIKLRRTELRMTIKELSELTGITEAAISKIERGETDCKISTIALLRSALALDIEVKPL